MAQTFDASHILFRLRHFLVTGSDSNVIVKDYEHSQHRPFFEKLFFQNLAKF